MVRNPYKSCISSSLRTVLLTIFFSTQKSPVELIMRLQHIIPIVIVLLVGKITYFPLEVTAGDESDENNSETTSKESTRKKHESCTIQLNEIYLGNGNIDSMQFVELIRYCPHKVPQPKNIRLDGYVIMAVELQVYAKVLFIALLQQETLSEVLVTGGSGSSEKKYFLHVTGTPNTPQKSLTIDIRRLSRNKKIQFRSQPDLLKVFPTAEATNSPVVFFLLYFPFPDRSTEPYSQINLDFYKDRNTGAIKYFDYNIKESQIDCIKNRIVDYVVYGKEPTINAENFMKNVLIDPTFELAKNMIFLSPSRDISDYSFSRCDNNLKDHTVFDLLRPTPLAPNNCHRKYVAPYKFQGHPLKSDGQRIAVNVLYFLKYYQTKLGELTWGTVEMASNMLGIGKHLVRNLEQRHITNQIETPGKKRKMPKWKQLKVDSFDRGVIRSIIAKFYKDNLAPYFRDIFGEFKKYKEQNCVEYTASSLGTAPSRWLPLCHEVSTEEISGSQEPCSSKMANPLTCTPTKRTATTHEAFTISAGTFAKVLKDMGFYYGRVDKRVALLMRQDILAWRGRYLKALRENLAREDPFKVTFLDETWIDPNLKSKKGWTLKRPKSYRDSLKYSYGRLKQGHGPRIIALAAGDTDGIIPESVEVYKVQKNANAYDYHQNVNRDGFMNWFKRLLDLWKTKQEKHLIIMDNAPYHSSILSPKQSQKKAVLFEWLEKIKNNPAYNIQVPISITMRKWELWQLVQSFKKKPELQNEIYELDNLVAAEGHIIVRLPPYQCDLNAIEFTWSDVKQQVARENLRQDVDQMVEITRNALMTYSTEKWKKQVDHVKRLGQKYWEEDGWMDTEADPVIIPLNEEDDEDEFQMDSLKEQCDETVALVDEDFDPEDTERQWQQDVEDVAEFHEQTPHFPHPPPIQPIQLFNDDD